MKKVYLDYASLTPIDKKVQAYMKKFMADEFMNPSALYRSGVAAKKAVSEAREKIARILHAHADEIIFTASGTEANNLAVQGIKGKHIIVSAIEHSSILETARALEKKGVKVSFIPVDKNGIIDLEILRKSITSETVLVSIMLVNNEIGTIEPISEVAKIVRAARKSSGTAFPLLHTDACQAGYLVLDMQKMGVDMMTLDSHKIYGPRGIGMLYVKRGIELDPIIYGGGQERGFRSGTENVPGIVGFAEALQLTEVVREKESSRLAQLKEFFRQGLLDIDRNIKINGDLSLASPHIIHVSIPNIDNEFFVLQLDARGVSCSTKSACLRDQNESYVAREIGADSGTSVRFSFGRDTKKGDLVYTLKKIKEILRK